MANSPEIDGLLNDNGVAIADRNSKTKQRVGILILLLAGAAAIALIFANEREIVKNPLDNEEEFRTTNFRPESFVRQGEGQQAIIPEPPKNDNVLVLPTPPPPVVVEPTVESSEFNVPPPPGVTVLGPATPAVVTSEGVVAVEPEVELPPEFPAKWKSKSIVVDSGDGGNAEAAAEASEAEDPLVAGVDKSSKFLAAVSNTQDRAAQARKIERIDAFIPEGTLIPGILETAINSDLPGQVRAIVSKDVYSFDGRRILIPTGSRLIGEYDSGITTGQKRVFIVWSRLLRDDGVSVRLNSIGADSLGRSGLTGFVDKKFRERFGAAILLSVISGLTEALGVVAGDVAGTTATETAGETITIASDEFSKTSKSIASQALEEGLKIPPTISVDQGERIFVFVRQDLDFSALYPSPVEEEIEKIKIERGLN